MRAIDPRQSSSGELMLSAFLLVSPIQGLVVFAAVVVTVARIVISLMSNWPVVLFNDSF